MNTRFVSLLLPFALVVNLYAQAQTPADSSVVAVPAVVAPAVAAPVAPSPAVAAPVVAASVVTKPGAAPSAVSLSSAVSNIAVLDITGSFKYFTRDDLAAITSRFETELMKTEKVKVLERRNMDMILQEQGFQQSGACNTSECQVQVGQLLGVDRIITGSLTKADKLYTMNLKMVDVGNGQNIMSHALDIRGSMEDLMRGGCFEMAQIFAGLKKPSNDHSVLTSEKASLWPWIVGGVAVIAGAVTTVVIITQSGKTNPDKAAVIE